MACAGNCSDNCPGCAGVQTALLGGFGAIPGVCETPAACVAGDCIEATNCVDAGGQVLAHSTYAYGVCKWQTLEIPLCQPVEGTAPWYFTWQGIAALTGIAAVGGTAIYFVAKKSLASRHRARRRRGRR
jgi:hypothetical protein